MPRLRSRLAAFDLYLLAPIALGLLIFAPLLTRGVPNTADGMLHLYRLALWSDAWAQGDFWPRWHTALYQGFGYPLFNFYAPLLYVVGGLFSFVLPSAEAALKAVLLLACIAYPLGMYLWVRDIFSRMAAVVAAAAFTFAAYRFRELFIQGNYAQFLAWGLFPWILFFWRRLAAEGGRWAFAGAVISLTALLLTHNISAMLFAPFAAVYVLWQALAHSTGKPWPRLLVGAASAVLMGLIFWLPALAENSYTRVHVLTQGYFDVAGHFITLAEQWAATPLIDGRAANPTLPFNFGRLLLGLAAAGALYVLRPRLPRSQRGHLLFALGGGLFAAFLMLEPSLPIWHGVPYIAFAEFPSRLYGVALLFVALLAGASVEWLTTWTRLQAIGALLAVFALIITTANLQFPRNFLPVEASQAGLTGYEADYRAAGTTSASEYLSSWVTALPANAAVDKEGVRRALIAPPPGMQGEVVAIAPGSLTLEVTATAQAYAPIAQFYFPGWRATVDGNAVEIAPCTDAGLICVPVPAGVSQVVLTYAGTPLQHAADYVALAGLLALLMGIFGFRGAPPFTRPPLAPAARGPALALTALVLIITLLKIIWIAPRTQLFRITSLPGASLAQQVGSLAIGPDIRLIGWDIGQTEVLQGGELRVRLYWQAEGRIRKNYSSFIQLIGGPDQSEFGASTNMHPGNIPTSSWNSDFYVVDDHTITVAPGTPPILYTLRIGLAPIGEQTRIGEADLTPQVRVVARPPVRAEEIPQRIDASIAPVAGGPVIELLGYGAQVENNAQTGGDTLALTLYWRASTGAPPGQQVFVHLLDGEGAMLAQSDGAAYGGFYPPDAWRPGEIVRDTRMLALPPGSTPATVAVGLYDLATLARMPVTGAAANTTGDAVEILLP
jgi:hypothetical protein